MHRVRVRTIAFIGKYASPLNDALTFHFGFRKPCEQLSAD